MDGAESEALAHAVRIVRAGGLVVYPTETLYGLGADASSPAALRRLATLKGRDAAKPISVLVASRAMLDEVADGVDARAQRLIERFWPGPLTLVLPARHGLPSVLTGGRGTIGVRISSHPLARALVEALGRPLTATSANPGGEPAPVVIDEARRSLGQGIDAWLDGGRLPGGAGSTVLDVTVTPPRVVREGAVPLAAIEAALREPIARDRHAPAYPR